jgi:hypothetical protein
MTRTVIDTNCLDSEELRAYLAASRNNIAVITDYTELEMVKDQNFETFIKLTKIIADFPRQVVFTKETGQAASLRGKRKGLKKRLTDSKRTRDFRKYCLKARQADRGQTFSKQVWLRKRVEALAHLKDVEESLGGFTADLRDHAEKTYTAEELRIIRTHEKWTPELTGKVLGGIMEFAQKFFEAGGLKLPPVSELPYSFVFRFAICAYLHSLHWIAQGGGKGRKPGKIRNDMVDVSIAAAATCFDGLLSKDDLTNELYGNATFLLKRGFLKDDLLPREAKR